MVKDFKTVIGFGRNELSLGLPEKNLLSLAVPHTEIAPAPDPGAEARRAISEPIGTRRLREAAAPGKTAVIITSDHTRPTPVKLILPHLLDELQAGGVKTTDITVMAAPGTHRPSNAAEIEAMVGSDLFSRLRCLSHDSEDPDNMVSLGRTSRGTPVEINRRVMEADLRITVNIVEPHHSAGWSGGAKNIMPGVSSKPSVFQHHSLSREPGAEIGRLDGNPFKEDIDEIGRMAEVTFSVDSVMTENAELVRCFAGDIIKAHRSAAAYANSLLGVALPVAPDIVIAGVGGSPRDATFWQAEGKILNRIRPVVSQNGLVIMVAECAEGFGDARFEEAVNAGTPAEIVQTFDQKPYTVLGNKARRFADLAQKASLYFVTRGLTPEGFRTFPVTFFSDLQPAVDQALKEYGPEANFLVVPNASTVLMRVVQEEPIS